jgi:hypothetical protein
MKKSGFRHPILFSALAVITLVFYSCTANQDKDSGSKDTSSSESPSKAMAGQSVAYNFPSALQIASLFKKAGLQYMQGIANKPKESSKFNSTFSKSLNLGIYGADLAYCVLSKQSQEANDYVKATTELASDLGMNRIFNEGQFVQRFEKNISNEDSLRDIITELQMETDTYLQDNDQMQISAIAFSGAWIEVMYLGAKSFEQSKGKGISDKIAEQMIVLSKIIEVLKSHEKKESGIAGLVKDLDGLLVAYNGLDSVKKSKAEIKEEDSGVIISLTEDETGVLTKNINELRAKFITS